MSEGRRWPLRIIASGEVDPRTLTRHPLNPKVHPEEQDRVVEGSLNELGWLKRVIVNKPTGHVLDGEERILLAIKHGEETVPYDLVDIPPDKEGYALRVLDQSAALAEVDLARWATLFKADAPPEDAALRAFFTRQAEALGVREAPGRADEDAEQAPWQGSWVDDHEGMEAELAVQTEALRAEWGVEPGQVWQLGRHRVWCGDMASAAVHTQLLGEARADLVVTSPPYAVEKDYEHGQGVDEHRGMIRALGRQCAQAVVPGGFVVLNFAEVWAQVKARAWTQRERACIYPMSLEYWGILYGELGWDAYCMRVWAKPFARLRQPLWTYHTSLAHQQEWEHVWTWRLPGGSGEQVFEWDVSVHAVWDSRLAWVDPDGSGPWKHWSAGFPRFLPLHILKAHSARGARVWEPFLGGGTTLLACEELGRTCLGSDRDPGAVAVTLQRWSEMTGAQPVRIGAQGC